MVRFQCFRTDSSGVRWRLLGGNRRVLGLSVREHADQPAAMREVDTLRVLADEARMELERSESGYWWWRMSVHDEPVARSAQGFARKTDADMAAKRFVERVREASVDSLMMIFQSSHRGRQSNLLS